MYKKHLLNKKTKRYLLFLIIILAGFLRIWKLSSVPPSPSLDEVSIGWNAYSIMQTGADEYGNSFPILLRAYDDWRPALYVYLVIPFVKILGLTAISVRLPSALLGILTILATYYFTSELFKVNKSKNQKIALQEYITSHLPLLTSLLLAISPWHIYISRLGHEANAGLAFFVFAMLFFIKKSIYLSAIFMALSLMSYQSQKVVIPVILVVLLFLFRKDIIKNKNKYIKASLLALFILIPFIYASFQPDALIRFQGTSIFRPETGTLSEIKLAINQYLSHFKSGWLFFNPGRDAHKVPNMGLLYLWELPLIAAGIYTLIKSKIDRKYKYIIFIWFLSAPIPAAITTQAPHAMRSYTILPMWQILSAIGILSMAIWLYGYLANKALAKISIYLIWGAMVSISLFQLYENYFIIFPREQSDSFQYALSDAVDYVQKNQSSYNKIIFSNRDNLYQSYMFYLYNTKYDPVLYQKQGGTVSGGYAETHKFGKYEFRPLDWENEAKDGSALYIGNLNDIPENGIKQFYNLDGAEAIKISN